MDQVDSAWKGGKSSVGFRHSVSVRIRFRVATLLVLMCIGCSKSAPPPEPRLSDQELSKWRVPSENLEVLRFGFDLRTSPQEDARQYLPFLHYLEQATGYRFELRFTPADANLGDDLAADKVQFAAIGAVTYLRAARGGQVEALVRGRNADGRSAYRSYIVVRPDSTLRRVEDLRGRRLAFGNVTSTQGHLIPRIVLSQHGLALSNLAAYTYNGSHQGCADALLANRADACGMQDTLAERLAEQGVVRILYRSDYYPSSGIAVNRQVAPEVIARVRNALLEFDPTGRHAAGLYAWELTEMPRGFVAAQPNDYLTLQDWLLKLESSE